MNKIQTLKGFRDFLPQEAIKRNWLINKIRDTFEAWGFDPLETPTLEPLELFKGQIGEDEKLFFNFKDQGGREVALRYDQTVPACRVVGEYAQQLPMPFKRYQIQPAFRSENPQKGRYREFLQCDADIFGVASPLADAEVIALSLDIYRQIGFPKVRVLVNDRQLLTKLPYEAIVAIDKLKKLGKAGVVKDMVEKGITPALAQEYYNTVMNLQPNETIKTIFNYLKQMGFPEDWYVFDPTIARSFSYSTGPIWEVEIPGFRNQSVLGGERFDKLVAQISGVSIPGTGFALGFDRTLEAAEEFGLLPIVKTNSQVLVTIFAPNQLESSQTIVKTLRSAGLKAELYTETDKKIDKQLKYADRKGTRFCIIQGPDELSRNMVQLKDLFKKTQQEMNLEEVINELRK
ncbi:TPA: histidine--tRNA ligase [Patescibacteria group bacterium]|uniref:Histidine--tRNA ligase n=1 Tax=Candidatus Gottesmanbacteria bacterium GW2011_GWA1_43_11 TaxID=1618436 RepID=A0A0G1CIN0_9BACT|nr:MAG: Histidyl-tRNA synthetase [Candidatus Gottesmanbacteria bacterium GW2011_GWA1_43_11]HCS79315.1 histidine--tRNA ligase [Patescibacteria group bacterium]